MSYRRHFMRMLPPETQLPLLIDAMQPGDVLRINRAYHNRQVRLNMMAGLPRSSGVPTPKFKHKIWDDPQTMETCIERLG